MDVYCILVCYMNFLCCLKFIVWYILIYMFEKGVVIVEECLISIFRSLIDVKRRFKRWLIEWILSFNCVNLNILV